MVSLADLKNVKLGKSTRRHSLQPKRYYITIRLMYNYLYISYNPNTDTFDFKRTLRCVAGPRSPGGTISTDNIKETGEGLTPMIARALKKKFQVRTSKYHFTECIWDSLIFH